MDGGAEVAAQLAALNDALGLSETGNNEVLFLWLELALANRYQPAVPQAEVFLSEIGRAKFVRPLFAVLWDQGEANMDEGFMLRREQYSCLFREMILSWRQAWGDVALPFVFPQLHACGSRAGGRASGGRRRR